MPHMPQSEPSPSPLKFTKAIQSWIGRAHIDQQGSALQQSRIDRNLKIVEDYICYIKRPFKMF